MISNTVWSTGINKRLVTIVTLSELCLASGRINVKELSVDSENIRIRIPMRELWDWKGCKAVYLQEQRAIAA